VLAWAWREPRTIDNAIPARPRRPDEHRPLQLADADRAIVIQTLMSPRFLDYPPAQVYATLLDEGRYLLLASAQN
jgi:putative transposase